MDYTTFIRRLKEVRDIGRIENGYSHIICEIMYNDVLDTKKYMLVDTSTYQRTAKSNKDFLGENICAVPDFVITNKANKLEEINRYGCIEVKFSKRDVNDKNRLKRDNDTEGYLEVYKKVIYTNGWIWHYYDEKKVSDDNYGEEMPWPFDFTKECNEKKYNDLIKELKNIEWMA